MFYLSMPALEAEISYRHEQLKRDYQRPLWFRRKPRKPVTPTPCAQPVRARHAM